METVFHTVRCTSDKSRLVRSLAIDSFGTNRASKLLEVETASMSTLLAKLSEFISSVQPQTRKRIIWTSVILFVLQLYFVRELIAAELLFGALFAALFLLVTICYLIGTLWENGLTWADQGVRAVAGLTRRSYVTLEELSKKPFRHLRSESAQ
jgi:hypothetical protein